MFVIWLIPTQFFQLILYKFITLGFLGWSPLIFGLLPKFGPYNWRGLWETTGVILSFTLDNGRFRLRPSKVFRVSTSRSFPWSRVKKRPGGKCTYHPYQWESISRQKPRFSWGKCQKHAEGDWSPEKELAPWTVTASPISFWLLFRRWRRL